MPIATVLRSTMSCISSSHVGALVPSCTISRSAATSSTTSVRVTVIGASGGRRGEQLHQECLLDVEAVLGLVEDDRGRAVERLVADLLAAVGR